MSRFSDFLKIFDKSEVFNYQFQLGCRNLRCPSYGAAGQFPLWCCNLWRLRMDWSWRKTKSYVLATIGSVLSFNVVWCPHPNCSPQPVYVPPSVSVPPVWYLRCFKSDFHAVKVGLLLKYIQNSHYNDFQKWRRHQKTQLTKTTSQNEDNLTKWRRNQKT